MSRESVTLEGQFHVFAQIMGPFRSGNTISLVRSNYWMSQAKILDDRQLTMTDTWITFNKFRKSEITWDEWMEFLTDLCALKKLKQKKVEEILTNCGPPQYVVEAYIEEAAAEAAEAAAATAAEAAAKAAADAAKYEITAKALKAKILELEAKTP